VPRWQDTLLHAVLTTWLMFVVSDLRCAPPPGPHSAGTLNLPVFQANTQWWMAVAVSAMNVGLI
jgi:hypothetical protein